MFTSLQHNEIRVLNTAFRAGVTKRIDRVNANNALLLGLLIIPTLSGVVLIA